jgi:phosphoglycolate phosphatase-like HAD superfamily hydrolase
MDFSPRLPFFVGIDSDGCAFDTMELKHKECFIPNIINSYELQGVSKYAREVAEFVNLYSKSRGINRFPGLVLTLEMLSRRPEVAARGVKISIPQGLVDWLATETRLGNPALKHAVEASGDSDLRLALHWSEAVNESIEKMVRGVPPFPRVRDCLAKLAGHADCLVVSATPQEALEREWAEHDLTQFVSAICGQEAGTKQSVLRLAAQYAANQSLMIGDALGDYQAALANGALFYPINPGAEEASWRRLFEEGLDRFLSLRFAGDYQSMLLDEFNAYLPATAPWEIAS